MEALAADSDDPTSDAGSSLRTTDFAARRSARESRDGQVSGRYRELRLAPAHSPIAKQQFEARQTARCLPPGQLHRIAESRRSEIPFHRKDTKVGRLRDSRIARY